MPRATVIALGLGVVALVAMVTRSVAPERAAKVPKPREPRVARAPHSEPVTEQGITFSLPEPAPPRIEIPRVDFDLLAPGEARDESVEDLPTLTAFFAPVDDSSAALTADEAAELFRFPQRGVWDAFSRRLTAALKSGSLERLMALEPEVRAALEALQAIPGQVEFADWLEERLDDIEVAQRAAERDRAIAEGGAAAVPLYEIWLERMGERPPPARSRLFVPTLKPIFAEAQLPPALVWIAETESSFNPNARSPAGAKGLFQLMPRTARELGLRLRPHDQRLDPLKNARTAARYLAQLQERFGDWPLTLAAYNSGPTRVSRLIAARSATTFAEIADGLPTETQLYVPKVLATLAVREGVTPAVLAMTTPGLAFADEVARAAE